MLISCQLAMIEDYFLLSVVLYTPKIFIIHSCPPCIKSLSSPWFQLVLGGGLLTIRKVFDRWRVAVSAATFEQLEV